MKRLLKFVGIVFLVLVVLVGGLIAYLTMTLDMEQVKQRINSEVRKQTGRELLIKGDIGLSFFPWVGVEIGETHLGNAAGFSGDFASFSHAKASIHLIPLFSKQVQMSTLTLEGFTLNLLQRKDGVNNWDDLKGTSQAEPGAEKETSQGAEPMAAGFLLEGIEIRNANISYRDDKAGAAYTLADFNLATKQIGIKRDIPFTITFSVKLTEPAMDGRYDIKGIANIDPAGLVEVRDVNITSKMGSKTLPVSQIDSTLKTNLTFDQGKMILTANPFDFSADLTGDALPEKPTRIGLSASIEIHTTSMASALKPLTLTLPGSTAKGELSYRPQKSLKQIDFSLAFDQIDLARLAPPVGSESQPSPATGTTAKPAGGPNDALRSLLVNGDVTVARIIRDKLLISDVAMLIKMRDGQLRINPFTAKLYGGLASNDINIDLLPATPRIKATADLKGFEVGEYLMAAMDMDVISGTANVNADITLTAADPETTKRSLSGNAAFNVRDGALKGVNIPDMIRRAKATLSGQSLPPASVQQTDFTELSGTATMTNGLVRNDDLLMKSPLLRISGKGEANLPTEAINYLVTTTLVATTKGQEGKDLKDLEGVPIPIRITGNFARPDWQLDLKSVFEENVKSQAKGLLEETLKNPQSPADSGKNLLNEPKKSLEGLKNLFK